MLPIEPLVLIYSNVMVKLYRRKDFGAITLVRHIDVPKCCAISLLLMLYRKYLVDVLKK